MTSQFNDPHGSGSLAAMAPHLIAPLESGLKRIELELDRDGNFTVTRELRRPLILIELISSTGIQEITLVVIRGTDSPMTYVFPNWSEAGAQLAISSPVVDANGMALPTSFSVAAKIGRATKNARDLIRIVVREGNTAKLAYLMAAEKSRIRREAIQLRAIRQIDHAYSGALDQLGQDLGVPRFKSHLTYTKAGSKPEISMKAFPEEREPDAAYRERLRLFRWNTKCSKTELDHLINGVDKGKDSNTSALSTLGVKKRFRIQEADNQFSVGIHLIAEKSGLLDDFSSLIRSTHLIHPASNSFNERIHKMRLESDRKHGEIKRIRNTIRKHFKLPAEDFAIALSVALALESLGNILSALGFSDPLVITRGFEIKSGSRYNLGLGIDINKLSIQLIKKIHGELTDLTPAALKKKGLNVLSGTEILSPDIDPQGTWLFRACGFQTVHSLNSNSIFLSTLPSQGMRIIGPEEIQAGKSKSLEVNFPGTDDKSSNRLLSDMLKEAIIITQRQGLAGFKMLDESRYRIALEAFIDPSSLSEILPIFQEAGINSTASDALVKRLDSLPKEHWTVIILEDSYLRNPKTIIPLLTILKNAGIASVLPAIREDKSFFLILGSVALPGAGLNLAPRRSVGFRWSFVPIAFEDRESHKLAPEKQASLSPVGSRATMQVNIPGIYAIVVIGYTRSGQTDPYEFSISLPQGQTIGLDAYEFLMNALERIYPAGIQVNTWDLRRDSIDLDGDGKADNFPPHFARTYRTYKTRSAAVQNT